MWTLYKFSELNLEVMIPFTVAINQSSILLQLFVFVNFVMICIGILSMRNLTYK